jgi:hypothetical protein
MIGGEANDVLVKSQPSGAFGVDPAAPLRYAAA